MRIALDGHAVSPDGKWVAAISPQGELLRYPIDGGDGVPIPGAEPDDLPIQWAPDGQHVYVYQRGSLPTPVVKLNILASQRQIWKELQPADRSGVFTVSLIYMTRDGESYVYSFRRMLSDLYLASEP